jgi:2-dehydro-3-deoxyphosphooctonate aldolase (KDO 8-P synthase)
VNRIVDIDKHAVAFANDRALTLIAGPCVMETEKATLAIARDLLEMTTKLGIPLVFKASYDKANRTSGGSFRGLGMKKGMAILEKVRKEYDIPVLTDVHTPEEAIEAAKTVDILQVPAFLCRQTDLLVACAKTGRAINIKKGQFMAPKDMAHAAAKITASGNKKVMLTERGTTFGYNDLVVDMRGIEIMKQSGIPVIFDATHSVQIPGGLNGSSGGRREFIMPLATAAVALGIAGLFLEVHPNPEKALSDGPNSIALKDLPKMLKKLVAIDKLVKSQEGK